jgi:hypothetical protein
MPCDFINSHSRRRFVVVGLNEPETLGGRCLVLGLAPKCHDALAGDHFEPPFFVSWHGRSRHRFPPLSGRRAAPAVPSPPAYEAEIAGPAHDGVENIMQTEEIRAVRNRYQPDNHRTNVAQNSS